MEWRDLGIVAALRPFGEGGAVVSALTAEHGRHIALVRGARGKARRGIFQLGNVVLLTWKARLAEQLGSWSGELVEAHAAKALERGGWTAALASACAVLESALPERQPCPALYEATLAFLAACEEGDWRAALVRWELRLLAELGYGLALERCAVSGTTDDLCFVSPRSGRAVCRRVGAPYRDRLLPLPAFLSEKGIADAAALREGLTLTGFFLERCVLRPAGRKLPLARRRLVDRPGG